LSYKYNNTLLKGAFEERTNKYIRYLEHMIAKLSREKTESKMELINLKLKLRSLSNG